MISQAMSRSSLVGMNFPTLRVNNVQSFYADNVDLLIKAEMSIFMSATSFFLILDLYPDYAASGKTIAAFIPSGPPPLRFWMLPWKWEEDSNATLMLGLRLNPAS